MSKKFLKLTSLVMAIVMMMSMIGLQVSATDAEVLTRNDFCTSEGTEYSFYFDSQGVAYAFGTDATTGETYVCAEYYRDLVLTTTEIVIPSSVIMDSEQYDVTVINSGAFSSTDIVSVVIPDTVVTINASAFQNCASLETVEFIGESVTYIGSGAFYNCTSLVNFVMPNSVTELSSSVFTGCTSLESITLSESLETVSSSLFVDCTSLTSLIIPDSLTSYGYAFLNITNLTYLKMGSGCTSIEGGAFDNLTNLETLILGEGLTNIGSGSCGGTVNLKNLTIPASIETLNPGAFDDSNSIENIYYTGTQEQWDTFVANDTSGKYSNGTLGDVIAGTNTEVVVQCCAGHTVEDYLTFVSTTATADEAGVETYLCECGYTVEIEVDALGGDSSSDDDSSFDLGGIVDTFNTYIQAFISFINQIVEFFQGFGDMF